MNGQTTYRALLCGTALLVVALAAGRAQAQVADAAGTGPRIEFSALEHDFGEATSGENLETSFVFKNAGDGVLVIEKVTSG
jgi:hypothetical protein